MITEREYLNALDIVREYIKQITIETDVIVKNRNKTLFDISERASMRLHNVIADYCYARKRDRESWVDVAKRTIAKNISTEQLLYVRNCGKKSLQEFKELISE